MSLLMSRVNYLSPWVRDFSSTAKIEQTLSPKKENVENVAFLNAPSIICL